jgi:hypothetical protein
LCAVGRHRSPVADDRLLLAALLLARSLVRWGAVLPARVLRIDVLRVFTGAGFARATAR